MSQCVEYPTHLSGGQQQCVAITRVFIMDGGNWMEEGTLEKMFTNPKEERNKQFLTHIL